MKYKASLDITAKVITISVIVFSLIICFGRVRSIALNPADYISIYVSLAIILFFVIFLTLCHMFAPQSYILDPVELIIYRPYKDVIIKFKDITEIRIIDDSELGWTIRTAGVGGLFGYFGKYYSANYGSITFYATQRRNKVLIQTISGAVFIITPDDLQLVNEIRERI